MLCTFTTNEGKTLIVRSDDIRQISDYTDALSRLHWLEGDEHMNAFVTGTAAENRDRIQQEELDLIARVEAHRYETQKRLQTGYPVPPVERGRQAR